MNKKTSYFLNPLIISATLVACSGKKEDAVSTDVKSSFQVSALPQLSGKPGATTKTNQPTNLPKAGTKAPVVESILLQPDGIDKIIATIKVTDADSAEDKLETLAIAFEKSQAPAQDKIDWSTATKIKKGEKFTYTGAEQEKTYVVYVKATDETKNVSYEHGELLIAKAKATMPSADLAKINAVQKFITDLCPSRGDDKVKEIYDAICNVQLTAANPKFVQTFKIDRTTYGIEISESKIDLDDISYKALPESICELSGLKEIYFTGSPIKEIPDCIEKLTKLTIMDLSDNKLEKLTDRIGKLVDLVELNLNGNSLT